MMRSWTKLLPVFVFAWLARRCEVVTLGGVDYHDAGDVLIRRAARAKGGADGQ